MTHENRVADSIEALSLPQASLQTVLSHVFADIDEAVLAKCIATYQKLGCWTPHVEITEAAYQATLDIFEYNGLITERFAYDQVCAKPLMG